VLLPKKESLINANPEKGHMLEGVSGFLSANLIPMIASFMGQDSWIVNVLETQPLFLIPMLLVPAIILLIIALFVEMIKDSWRIAVGVIFDLLAIYFFVSNPLMLLLIALIAGITFHVFGSSETQHRIYTTLAVGRLLVLLPFIPISENLKIIIVLIPICTILAFFRCVTD
jgi:hypothetical protein